MEIIIQKATKKDIPKLALVGRQAFYTSHKDAISSDIMQSYLDHSFNEQKLLEEISNPLFQYHVMYCDDQLAGYSKTIFNTKNNAINEQPVTKMERLYLSEEFHGLGLGKRLFDFNINLMKENHQKGTWLYVWIKNNKALQFYKKTGFIKVADYDFPVSKTETRPNYVMFLKF